MQTPETFGIIAGNGVYPKEVAAAARRAGVKKIVAAAFTNETDPGLAAHVHAIEWLRVGQLGRLMKYFRDQRIAHAVMAGQIAPRNLFDLHPDWKALLLLARLKQRNAESIFGAIADELGKAGIELLPATTFLEDALAPPHLIAGPKLTRRQLGDVEFGWNVAKEVARLDIGQTVIVKKGTVLAIEGLDGTNETIRRGGRLAGTHAIMIKVSKPNQDMRFDVPVIGLETVRVAHEAGVRAIAIEAGRTLLLDKASLFEQANRAQISIIGR
jgi:UDP-2,3-diacylglucosamine hydrolase